MIAGKVIDKSTRIPMPGVRIILADASGEYLENSEGIIQTETNAKGEYTIDVSPGQYLHFAAVAYPLIVKNYEELIRNANIQMEDATGSGLAENEINALIQDARIQLNSKWMISVGIGILFFVLLLIILKKYSVI